MSNFQSYSTYVPESVPKQYVSGPQIREESQVHRVTIGGGGSGAMTQSSDALTRANSGQINPASGLDTWQATARTTRGEAVETITGDSLVTINGMQAKVSFFVKEGYLAKQADGSFTQGNGPAEAPPVDQGDILLPPVEMQELINGALSSLPAEHLDSFVAHSIGNITGTLTNESLVEKFAKDSAISLADAGQRVNALKLSYSAQADHALATRAGVGDSDKAAFYAWARSNEKGQLTDAVQRQLYSNDVSGYLALAQKWQSITAPSVAALQAAGIQTRTSGYGVLEVKIQNQWLTPKAAANAGLI
jgi:hypothetical protein